MPMNNQARHVLLSLRGQKLTRMLLQGILADRCSGCRAERSALLAAFDHGIVTELAAGTASADPGLRLAQLSQRLERDACLVPDAARWAVESFALYHGVVAKGDLGPLPPPPPTPPPPPPPTPEFGSINTFKWFAERIEPLIGIVVARLDTLCGIGPRCITREFALVGAGLGALVGAIDGTAMGVLSGIIVGALLVARARTRFRGDLGNVLSCLALGVIGGALVGRLISFVANTAPEGSLGRAVGAIVGATAGGLIGAALSVYQSGPRKGRS